MKMNFACIVKEYCSKYFTFCNLRFNCNMLEIIHFKYQTVTG